VPEPFVVLLDPGPQIEAPREAQVFPRATDSCSSGVPLQMNAFRFAWGGDLGEEEAQEVWGDVLDPGHAPA